MSQTQIYTNPQTGLALEPPHPLRIFELVADCRYGEKVFNVHAAGSGMWVTTEDHACGVPSGSILVRDRSQDATGKSPHVVILEGGLHSAIRQQADHLPAALTNEIGDLSLSVEMTLELCMDARALHLATPAEVAAWSRAVERVVDRIPSAARSQMKLEARAFLQFAVDPYDSLDRLNGPSRMLVLEAATRRLETQVGLMASLRDVTVNRRAVELFRLYDGIWSDRTLALKELSSMEIQFQRPETVTAEWAERAANRIDYCAQNLAGVCVAPYGTNSLRHASEGMFHAAALLREERFKEAAEQISIDRRGLDLLSLQRELEGHQRVVSSANRQLVAPPAKQQGALARILDQRRAFLEAHPEIDDGFRNRIAKDLAGHLERAVDAAVGQSWNGQGVYSALSDACACFGRNRKAA